MISRAVGVTMSKYDFVKDFVEQNMQFKDFDDAQLIFFKSQVTNLGIEVGNIDEEEFNNISEKLHRIYDEIAKATINNENMEDDTMRTINETAATNEEMKMAQKAKAKAEAVKDKLEDGFKYIVENVPEVADKIEGFANMDDAELGIFLKTKGETFIDWFVSKIKGYSKNLKENADVFPFLKNDADKADNVIELIKGILDTEGVSGWGKFKAIVKELINWIARLLLKVGAIVLKLAFTIAVGTIKIGATGLVTAGRAFGVINKEVIKPSVKAGKEAWNKHKEAKLRKAEEEFEDDFDDFDDMVEEAATIN